MKSTTKWSARNLCGCSKCKGPTEFSRWKVGDRRVTRRRGTPLDDGYGPQDPDPSVCDGEVCQPYHELFETVDKACRWELPR